VKFIDIFDHVCFHIV